MNDIEGFLDLVERDESAGRNIKNWRYDPTHTASGYYQITDTTWKRYAPMVAGAEQYASADAAPKDVQRAVARAIAQNEGSAPWANYNQKLAGDLGEPFIGAFTQEGSLGQLGPLGSSQRPRSLPGDFASLGSALRSSLRREPTAKIAPMPRTKELPMPKLATAGSTVTEQQQRPVAVHMGQASAPNLGAAYREALSRILSSGRGRA